MKAKRAIKIGVDIAMTVLFLCQMGYHMMDNRAHEWLGIALCLLFILHHGSTSLPLFKKYCTV